MTRRTDPDRRTRLVDVTLDLIAARGVAGATYRTIAEAADVPLGSMTYHFASRDELMLAAFERFSSQMLEDLDKVTAPADGADPVERLARMIEEGASTGLRERVLLGELYVLAYRDERYAALLRRWMVEATARIERAFPGADARALDAVQEGLTLQRYFLPEEVDGALIRSALTAVASATGER